MIFVTVGTHEQPFDRLLKIIDEMIGKKLINEEVIVQRGYSNYEPQYCKSYKLIDFNEMQNYIDNARIIVTHGGPASFIAPLSIGKIPIVVPRQKKYGEHINDHQLIFTRQLQKRMNTIILAEEEENIISSIINYDSICSKMGRKTDCHNSEFVMLLKKEIKDLFNEQEL